MSAENLRDALRCVLDIGARRLLLPSEVAHWEALLVDTEQPPTALAPSVALAPCPFCGSAMQFRAALWPSDGDGDGVMHAEPTDCPVTFESPYADRRVIEQWNKRASLAQQGEAVAWQYRYKSEGPNGFTYNTFVHPITGMGRDADAIDWWVLGVKPRPAAVAVDAEEVARIAAHIGNAVEYIEKAYPGTKTLDAGPILRNMRRWSKKLTAALLPATSEGEKA